MQIKLFTIPNTITLANLLCGTGSIVASLFYGDMTAAFVLIMAAAVFDFFDGFAARLLHRPSVLGVQLDSLADMVSFGTAPAAAFFVLYGHLASASGAAAEGIAGALRFVPFIMTAFSALRLARFNVDDTQHEEFRGLTTTANAIFCGSFAMMCAVNGLRFRPEWIALLSFVMAYLLVSPVRMFSFKMTSFGWQGNRVRWSFAAFAAVSLLLLRTYSVPFIIVMYIAVSTFLWLAGRRNSSSGCKE